MLQINVNRSVQAMDLARATAAQLNADVLAITEPNVASARRAANSITDLEEDTTIIVLSNLQICKKGTGNGYVYIQLNDLTIVSLYASPNEPTINLERILDEVSAVTHRARQCVVTGDFNAKSPLWDMPSDARGRIVEAWAAANNFYLENQPGRRTFFRREYSSTLDLTFTNAAAHRQMSHWEVLEDETLSDHRTIFIALAATPPRSQRPKETLAGWNTRSLSQDCLREALEILPLDPSDHTDLTKYITTICDRVMPRRVKQRFPRHPRVYWWNNEIAALRTKTHADRRKYDRAVKKNSPIKEALHNIYTTSKKALKDKIAAAKRNAWEALISELDNNIWGDAYKIVKKRMGKNAPARLTKEESTAAIKVLFPSGPAFNRTRRDTAHDDSEINAEGVAAAASSIRTSTAPGPNAVPSEIVKAAAQTHPEQFAKIFNNLYQAGQFPKEWKSARLVLIPKPGKDPRAQTTYRPISLLDSLGKLFERVLLSVLQKQLNENDGLSDNQYGFRKGRQTIDAVNKVIETARAGHTKAYRHRTSTLLVTFDVRNAFNAARWEWILAALKQVASPKMYNIVDSFLHDREMITPHNEVIQLTRGVPQGSVLGPTLWNVMYDQILRINTHPCASLIGFADDLALTVTHKNMESILEVANNTIADITAWVGSRDLALAPHKTEAVLLTTKKRVPEIGIMIDGLMIKTKNHIKYLGIWLDSKLTFKKHVTATCEKAVATTRALAAITANTKGPDASKRKLLMSTVQSAILYGAPVWANVTKNRSLTMKLISVQRLGCLRTIAAYRTISAEAANVLARTPPIDLLIQERLNKYKGLNTNLAKSITAKKWQDRWASSTKGRWTNAIIPVIADWTKPKGEGSNYYTTQALSNHGNFRKYLADRHIIQDPSCPYCGAPQEDAEHVLLHCTKYHEIRAEYTIKTRRLLTIQEIRERISDSSWDELRVTMINIIKEKEAADRLRLTE